MGQTHCRSNSVAENRVELVAKHRVEDKEIVHDAELPCFFFS